MANKVDGATCKRVTYPSDKRWTTVATDPDGGVVSVDTATILREANKVTAWVRYDLGSAYESINGSRLAYSLQREQFDCKAQTASTRSYASYGDEGQTLRSQTFANGMPAEPLVPGSKGELVGRFLCQ